MLTFRLRNLDVQSMFYFDTIIKNTFKPIGPIASQLGPVLELSTLGCSITHNNTACFTENSIGHHYSKGRCYRAIFPLPPYLDRWKNGYIVDFLPGIAIFPSLANRGGGGWGGGYIVVFPSNICLIYYK